MFADSQLKVLVMDLVSFGQAPFMPEHRTGPTADSEFGL